MQVILNRRGFFKNSLSAAICASLAPYVISKNAFGFDAKGLSFWEEYYEGAMKILNGLRDTQVEIIEKEMKTAYERTRKRGTVYSQITAGHFPTAETALDRIGNPGVFAFLERGANEERYAKLHEKDVIIIADRVIQNWWRKVGHLLAVDDLDVVIQAAPDKLIVGAGKYARLNVPEETSRFLSEKQIELETYDTKTACQKYNQSAVAGQNVAAALHLTC